MQISDFIIEEQNKKFEEQIKVILGIDSDSVDKLINFCEDNNMEPLPEDSYYITLINVEDYENTIETEGVLREPFILRHPELLVENKDGSDKLIARFSHDSIMKHRDNMIREYNIKENKDDFELDLVIGEGSGINITSKLIAMFEAYLPKILVTEESIKAYVEED